LKKTNSFCLKNFILEKSKQKLFGKKYFKKIQTLFFQACITFKIKKPECCSGLML